MSEITLHQGLLKAEWDLLYLLKSTQGIIYFIPDNAIGKFRPVKVFPQSELPAALKDNSKPVPQYIIMSRRERRAGK